MLRPPVQPPHQWDRVGTRIQRHRKVIAARRRVLQPVARRSMCVKAEHVAVRVCQLDVARRGGQMGRAERDQSFRLAGGVGADQVEALPVPSVLRFGARLAPRVP